MSEQQVLEWIARWITAGFNALEQQIARHGQGFAFGDRMTLADCCLVPQVYSAERFGVLMIDYPAIRACADRCLETDAFRRAHPDQQPDAD
ncbi:glutathione S-transferase C-terminal domain-containing protein [Novosphingobium arvoryzae]|uniref:glutathione S-transferase C-terminal domain-containing protein n=1 Tax=Novosphingobium arvoryzae TaxID=1256514 RepID=UPI001E2FEB9C|nr:glutathione S-transferase C-terminal domain-containing protein [Novosphingobium arvoryzae]